MSEYRHMVGLLEDMQEEVARAVPGALAAMAGAAMASWPARLAMLITGLMFAQTSVVNLGFALTYTRSNLYINLASPCFRLTHSGYTFPSSPTLSPSAPHQPSPTLTPSPTHCYAN